MYSRVVQQGRVQGGYTRAGQGSPGTPGYTSLHHPGTPHPEYTTVTGMVAQRAVSSSSVVRRASLGSEWSFLGFPRLDSWSFWSFLGFPRPDSGQK